MNLERLQDMDGLSSYPQVFQIGHAALGELFLDDVLIEEKVDGSQFSFGYINGSLLFRSKGKNMNINVYEKMFSAAVETVKSIQDKLTPGWIYRAEFLSKPKHNTLCYDRIPMGCLILFDVCPAREIYLSYEHKLKEAERLGLEVVPRVYEGRVESPEQIKALLDRTSLLGKEKIEGVVVKNYERFGKDKKILVGKFVREDFKELNKLEWKSKHPTQSDILLTLIDRYKSEPRWMKSVQHLKELGELNQSPQDIGLLMKEVPEDIRKECEEEIKLLLFSWAWPTISRGVLRGFPEWYKNRLLESSFGSNS